MVDFDCIPQDYINFVETQLNYRHRNRFHYDGVGYPVYKNTVVFHSTPEPWGDIQESILHGLDIETGKERWRLSNKDFAPKKSLKFNNILAHFSQTISL